jgi:hypothetical protein
MRFIIGINNLGQMKYFIILLVTFFMGCAVANGPVYYIKSKDKNKILRQEYSQMDTLYLKYYSFDARMARVTFRSSLGKALEYKRDTVWMNLFRSLYKTNLPIKVSQTPVYIEIPEWYTLEKNPEFFREKILNSRLDEDSAKFLIVPIIGYYSAWKEEINAGLTAGSISPSDRLEHDNYYDVDLYVLYKNELVYYCRALKRDTLTREPSEPYRYHFPQELWDTLVYMSTRDYLERMR